MLWSSWPVVDDALYQRRKNSEATTTYWKRRGVLTTQYIFFCKDRIP